jgi:hypothetical protein
MTAIMKNSAFDRKVFEHVISKLPEGSNPPSPSYLRVDQTLQNAKSVYTFDIAKTSGESVCEKKLDRNDLFVVTKPMFYITREDNTKIGKSVMATYANEEHFTTAVGFDVTDLETVYNGFFSLKIGQVENIPLLPMKTFKIVPGTQMNIAGKLQSEWDALQYMPDIPSLLFISGTMNVEIKVEIPSFAGIAMESPAIQPTINHKLIFHPYGFLIRNAASKF